MSANPFLVLFRHSFIYGIGQALVSMSAFILLPVFTNPQYLPIADYGVWQILNVTMTILVAIFGLGMATTLFRFYYQEKIEAKRLNVSNTIFWLLIISSVLFYSLFLTVIQPFILPYLNIDTKIIDYANWILIGALFQVASIVPLNILRAEERPWQYITFQIVQFILLLTFLLLFLIWFRWQLRGMVIGYVLAFGGNFLLLTLNYLKKLRFHLDFALMKRMLQFGLPLIVLYLGGWILSVFDRYLIGFQISYDAAAIYSVGYQFGAVVNIAVIMPFSVAWGPFMFKVYEQPKSAAVYAKTMNYVVFACLYTAFLLSLFAQEILSFFTNSPEYLNARPIIAIVAFAHVFYGMYFVFTTGLNVTNRTHLFPSIILASAGFNLVANYLFIPRFGIIAAAVITVLSYLLLAFLTSHFSQKYYKIPFEVWKIVLLFLVFMGTSIMGYFWSVKPLPVYYLIKLLISILPLILLYWFNFFTNEELNFIKKKLLSFTNG